MSDATFDHAPGANLDYSFDWSLWLETGDSISTSSWTADSGITLTMSQLTGAVCSVYASGGTVGTLYKITNTITTSLNKTDNRTMTLSCKHR